MTEKIDLDLSQVSIDQLGYLYKDIEKQANLMEDLLNMPKFTVLPPNKQVVKYRGKDSEIITKIAMTRMFNLQIELIELIEGECVFKEFLDQGKEGLQHISLFFDDFNQMEPYIQYFNDKGYEIVHAGNIGIRYFYYFDTTEVLGYMFEIQASKIKRRKRKP